MDVGSVLRWLVLCLAGLAIAAPAAGAQIYSGPDEFPSAENLDEWGDVPWTDVLPGAPVPTTVQPHGVPGCREASVKCAEQRIKELRKDIEELGCDHRAVWVTSAYTVWEQVKKTLDANPNYFEDGKWAMLVTFESANLWLSMNEAYEQGRELPGAWEVYFDAMENRDNTAVQDEFAAINGHMQYDVPFALASQGLRFPDGRSRKPDWERFHKIVRDAYETIAARLDRKFDPLTSDFAPDWHPVDNVGALQLGRVYRETTWRNAERLLNATTDAERDAVRRDIDAYTTAWAKLWVGPEIPGHREFRDEYCANAGDGI